MRKPKMGLIIGIGIGVIFVWISSMIAIFGDSENAYDAMRALKNTGIASVAGSLILFGGIDDENDRAVRTGMVIMGAIVILALISSISMTGALGPIG